MVHVNLIAENVVVVLPEAQLRHVGLDGDAVKVLGAVAEAGLQFGRGGLPPQDADAVHAPVRALAALEHGLAEPIVVLQGGGAEGIGGANPLGRGA